MGASLRKLQVLPSASHRENTSSSLTACYQHQLARLALRKLDPMLTPIVLT